MRLGRGGNDRHAHWRGKHARVTKERDAVRLLWPWRWRQRVWRFPVLVTLTRISPSAKPLDDDNLVASCKGVRDQVAAELRVDDGDRELIRFAYASERGPWGVRIHLEERR